MHSLFVQIIIGCGALGACSLGVVGNLLVLSALAGRRRFRRVENVFLGSLAIADLAVALLVMPLAGSLAIADLAVALLVMPLAGCGALGACSLGVVGNLLVLSALAGRRRFRRVENVFLGSLAIADLAVALLVMPLAGAEAVYGGWPLGMRLCDAWTGLAITACTASIFSLCAISLDRYLIISDPFKYSGLMTRGAALVAVGCLWTTSAAMATLPITLGLHRPPSTPIDANQAFDAASSPDAFPLCACDLSPPFALITSVISFFIPCFITGCVYFRLFLASRYHLTRINILRPPDAAVDRKAAVTIGIVMGVFVGCWLPFFALNVVSALTSSVVPAWLLRASAWLGMCNSALDPVVYTALDKRMRRCLALELRRRSALRADVDAH